MGLACSAYAQPGINSASVNGVTSPSTSMYIYPGSTTSISSVFQDNGAGLSYAFYTFDVWPSPSYACKVGVQIGSPLNQSLVYLHDDNGNELAGMTVGANQSESNSKCQVFAAGSSVTQSGSQYTVTVSVIFNDPYNGTKYVYVNGYDRNMVSSGWYCPNAAFTVYSTDYAPQAISVSPASGSSQVGQIQTFQVTIHDTNGAFTMWHLEFMLAPEGGGWQPGYNFQPTQRCKVVAEASADLIWVESDTENGMSPPGYGSFGASSPASISSNRCTLYPSMTSEVYTDIDTAVITFAVSFSSNLTGQLQDHMYIADNLGLDHWDTQSDGTWNWNVSGEVAPVTSSPVYQPPPEVEAVPTPPAPVSASNTNCNDISGVWTGPAGSGSTYSIDTSGGTLKSDSAWVYCGVTTPMTGFRQADGTWQINVAGEVYACGYDFPPITAIISPGCTTATVTAGGGTTTTSTRSDGLTAFATTAAAPSTTWTRSGSPGISVTLDLMAGKITTHLAGQKAADLTVNLNNSQGTTMFSTPHTSAQGGNSFSDGFRTLIQAGQQYGTVTASWDTTTLSVPVSFFTIGYTHFTQYNTPYHSSCSGTPQETSVVYKMDAQNCYYRPVMLVPAFIDSVKLNGTGVYDANGANTVLKSYAAGAMNVCPAGFASETFFAVDAGGNPIATITGTHNKVLSDATGTPSTLNKNNPQPGSLATDPSKTNSGSPLTYLWADSILLFDSSDRNDARGLRSVQDLCPACRGQATQQSSNSPAHIDMYNATSSSCSARAVGDYGYYYAIRLR